LRILDLSNSFAEGINFIILPMVQSEAYKIIKDYFLNKPVKKVQVFGSYARNQAKASSDIDLILTLEHPVGLISLAGYMLDLESLLKKKVDLSTEPAISPEFLEIIQEDLKVVYERD